MSAFDNTETLRAFVTLLLTLMCKTIFKHVVLSKTESQTPNVFFELNTFFYSLFDFNLKKRILN